MAAYGSDLLCRTPGRVALKAGTQRLASSCVCSHVPVQARALPVSHFLFAAWTSPGSFLSLPSRGFQRAQCAQRLPVRQGQSLSCGHGPVENRTGALWRHRAGGTAVAVEGLRKNTSDHFLFRLVFTPSNHIVFLSSSFVSLPRILSLCLSLPLSLALSLCLSLSSPLSASLCTSLSSPLCLCL